MDDTYRNLYLCFDYLAGTSKKRPECLRYIRGYGYYCNDLRLGLDKYDATRRMRFMLGPYRPATIESECAA